MNTKHTAGRLVIEKGSMFQANDESGKIVASGIESKANARRLVACWNACEGISTEALEHGHEVVLTNRIYQALMRDRDELIEALGLMFKAWEQLMPNLKNGVVQNYELVCTTAPVKARALLARHAPKVTG